MKEYAFIFRMDLRPEAQPDAARRQLYMQQWDNWMQAIEAAGLTLRGGNHFAPTGSVILSGNRRNDGPYQSQNQSVAGYILVGAENLDQAMQLAAQCPILHGEGNSVEIRETAAP